MCSIKKLMCPMGIKLVKGRNWILMTKKLEIGGVDILEPWALMQSEDRLKLTSWLLG